MIFALIDDINLWVPENACTYSPAGTVIGVLTNCKYHDVERLLIQGNINDEQTPICSRYLPERLHRQMTVRSRD